MQLSALHPQFGVEVQNLRLNTLTAEQGFPEIRALFEEHSLLLFRDQHLHSDEQLRLGCLFGVLEDRSSMTMDVVPEKVIPVSNVQANEQVYVKDDLRLLNLQANMLWHTDSTFLPTPALANLLQAEVVPSSGGATELVSTRAGFARLDAAEQQRLRATFFWHRYSHSRQRIHPELAQISEIVKWPEQCWRAVWRNPVNGKESLYIASHAFAVEGVDEQTGQAYIDELMAKMTPDEAIYRHEWQPGDVLIWDERATLHRGTPWPYEEARTLVSICVSVAENDGVGAMRAVSA